MRKTALLSGVAGLLLMTAPAFAQDSTAPQTPPAPPAPATAPQEPMAPPAAATPAAPQTLNLSPGAPVNSADGVALGVLEGVRSTSAGQELTVRGTDGQLRGVPVSGGVEQNGPGVNVGWSQTQFQAAPAIEGSASAPVTATPPAGAEPVSPAPTTEPMTPPDASTPTLPPEPAEPATPPTDGDDEPQ
ncbi:superoxide dismutase [Brevundimonas sp.]